MTDTAKPTATEVREAFSKLRTKIKTIEGKTEEKVGVVVGSTVSLGSAFVAGVVHERYGKMDEKAGQKILRFGGVNAGALAGIAGIGGELFEVAGKRSEFVGRAGVGVGCQATGDWGRAFQRGLAKREAERDAAKAEADKKKAAELEASKAAQNGAATQAQAVNA